MFTQTFPVGFVRSPVVEIGAGLFFGLFAGQQAVRLLLISPPGKWLLGALGRTFLSYSGELPWRLRAFLRYAARIDLVREEPDGDSRSATSCSRNTSRAEILHQPPAAGNREGLY